MKNITALRDDLLRREGGKKQVNVAQMTEVLAHLSDIVYEENPDGIYKPGSSAYVLHKNGKRRALAKLRNKK